MKKGRSKTKKKIANGRNSNKIQHTTGRICGSHVCVCVCREIEGKRKAVKQPSGQVGLVRCRSYTHTYAFTLKVNVSIRGCE